MTTITVINTEQDANLAGRVRDSLEKANYAVSDLVQAGRESLTILIFSDVTLQSQAIQDGLITALENRQHIIPITTGRTTLPHLIDHLQPLDFSNAYNENALLQRVGFLTPKDAPPPMTVLTPAQRAANRRIFYYMSIPVLIVFVASLYLIGIDKRVQPPAEEFASVDTQVFLTRIYYIERSLPQSTQDALNFEATIEDMPTRAQVQLIQTATANAGGVEGTYIPRSTEDAVDFAVTLQYVSTVVQDGLAETVTSVALTSQAISPTATPEAPADD